METYLITVNGVQYEVQVEKKGAASAPAAPAVKAAPAAAAPAAPAPAAGAQGSIKVEAGAAGKVWKIVSKVGDSLKAGDSVLILEAMKMEIPVVAPKDGVVASIECSEGQPCEAGDLLATLK